MILNTFTFVILLLLLIFVVFALVSPVLTLFFTTYEKIQTGVEIEMFGNITNSTQEMLEAQSNVKMILPYLVIFSFIVGVLIWAIFTEQIKIKGD